MLLSTHLVTISNEPLSNQPVRNPRKLIVLLQSVATCLSSALIISVCVLFCSGSESRADEPDATSNPASATSEATNSRYSPEVVEKAEEILQKVGLKRSGRIIQSIETAAISRSLSVLNRTTRELRLVNSDWKSATQRLEKIERELKRLIVQDGELNLQLARAAGVDVSENNRLVALINATRTQKELIRKEETAARRIAAEKRAALNRAEADYAGIVLAIRKDYEDLENKLRESLSDREVQIAMKVIATNYRMTEDWTAAKILATLDKKIQQIEKQIFSESIPLQVEENGSLYVNVVVGTKSARMVVDSGATMVSLPAKTAAELEIKVPVDAPRLNLVLADGRTIPARRVTLKQVRVGQFEAEGVDAAILDPSATGSQPLLGMSFLGNFKFEINTPERSLKMLRVATEEL